MAGARRMAEDDTPAHGAGEDGRARVIVEDVQPTVDGGRHPAKRVAGDRVLVEADVFADGHDVLGCVVLHRPPGASSFIEVPMQPLGNDRWRGELTVGPLGRHAFKVTAWVDAFRTWTRDLARRVEARQDVGAELPVGARLVDAARARAASSPAASPDARRLEELGAALGRGPDAARVEVALGQPLAELMARHAERAHATTTDERVLVVERERARTGAWYELFPRSCAAEPGSHGRLRDVERLLPELEAMGFDVIYLPPIHPIGRTHRKGPNNSLEARPGDPGSPWAIGAAEGGHKAVHPDLGTLEDLRRLVASAGRHGLELALDVAFQCSPDHPYVKDHPEWFRKRPDGTIRYAENPPKKYQDIFPFDFECEDWRGLWTELASVVRFWIEQGVTIFRVDNPHTKPIPFWEWLITSIKADHPETIFLSEAFTRPRVMQRLAKVGFSQSYTYFTWRNTKAELTAYLSELERPPLSDFLRPALWPNTPDILPEYLQVGGRAAFAARLVLAATLGATYGIYGPAFELCEARPVAAGKEEYADSEKYEVRRWDRERPDSLRHLIARVNRIRRERPALQAGRLTFQRVDNEQLIAYTRATADLDDVVLTVVNLDPHHTQSGWLELDLPGLDLTRPYQVHDLISDARYLWQPGRNFLQLDPTAVPAHVFRLRRRVRTEQDFDYYL